MSQTKQPLLVTTVHRGVFFGYGVMSDEATIELEQSRMCVSWSNDVHGVLGLATSGPSKTCKIGPAVSRIVLREVTAVALVSPEAITRWESEPWG